MARRLLAVAAVVGALLLSALPASAQQITCDQIVAPGVPPGAVARFAAPPIEELTADTGLRTIASRAGSSQSFCLEGVTPEGDLVVTLTYSPFDPEIQGAFDSPFNIEVRNALTGDIITRWVPLQPTPGRAVFTLSGQDPEGNGADPDFRGPFILRVLSFVDRPITYRMQVSGPGARLVEGADLSLIPTTD